SAVALDSSGRYVVAGEFAQGSNSGDFLLGRLNDDLSFDPTFNGGALIRTPVSPSEDGALAVAVGTDGAITVGGFATAGAPVQAAAARYIEPSSPEDLVTGVETSLDYNNVQNDSYPNLSDTAVFFL